MSAFDFLYCPQSIAVIGASRTEGKIGYAVLANILNHGFPGEIHPVNPHAEEILGLRCYPTVAEIPHVVDMAVIVVPAPVVPEVLTDCGEKGVKGAVVISAGFGEVGGEGMAAERELADIAGRSGMRMLGPNCLGIIDTLCPLNATFARGMPERGKIAVMSQSGALLSAILDWAVSEEVGFSRFVSLGNKADINEVDLLDAWGGDPHTRVITAYLEGIADGQRFVEAARRVTPSTPVIAIKAGTSESGARAVSSHTGSLAGSERAYDTALRQSGVIRADSVEELFDIAMAFDQQPQIQGDALAIVTNAGGPSIMATDDVDRAGLKLAALERSTIDRLRGRLPPEAAVLNPVDCLGDASADRYGFALATVLEDPGVDGALAIFLPQLVQRVEETAQVVGEIARSQEKPVLACIMGEEQADPGIEVLRRFKVPNYRYPERAVTAFRAMHRRRRYLTQPPRDIESFTFDRSTVDNVFTGVLDERRLTVSDEEARKVLSAYGIRVPRSLLASSAEEAAAAAEELGYPVAAKIASPDILHKTDIGGVRLDLGDTGDVRDAFDLLTYRAQRYMPQATLWGVVVQEMMPEGREILVGMSRDPQFGPLLAFGLGGIYVETLRDVAFRLAPVSRWEAEDMIQEIAGYPLLRGVRGEPPADIEEVVDCLLRVSQLVTEYDDIVEMDINPLLVMEAGKGAVALDARMTLASPDGARDA